MSNAMTSKSHSKKSSSSRDRDKNRAVASESGGSSQCDTPPLIEKEGGPSQGRYPGVSAESVHCMAEQCGTTLLPDAASHLAEDVSYKLRQLIHTIALHSEMSMKSRVDSSDVNSCLQLADTSPVVGADAASYTPLGEENLFYQAETLQNITECALTSQTYNYTSLPTLAVEWITDDKNLSNNSHICPQLQNYYTKVARAILNLKRKPKELAVRDLTSNPRIGPIIPNLFNLAVLVLNDDNLKALQVPAKKPLQSNVLDMMDALCSNPCSLDTNIQQQFQRLFPVMASNILSNGSLSEKMVAVLTKIIRTWPSFAVMGKEILFEYVSKGPRSAITGGMVACLAALGRAALAHCLAPHLHYIDAQLHAPAPRPPAPRARPRPALPEATLDAATCLLRAERRTPLEDHVATDYTLYEMLGDALLPRRLLRLPESAKPEGPEIADKTEDDLILPRTYIRPSRLKLLPRARVHENSIHRESVFEPVRFSSDRIHCRIHIKVQGFKNLPVRRDRIAQAWTQTATRVSISRSPGVAAASGMLNRFRFRLNKSKPFPIFGGYML